MRFMVLNKKTISIFLIWLSCIGFHKFLSNKVYEIGFHYNLHNEKPLLDMVHLNFPSLQKYRIIPEILHLIPVLYVFFLIFYNMGENSILALNKLLKTHGILLVMRSVFFASTLLPDASQVCSKTLHIGSCFDLIFSGHCMAIYLSTFTINKYFKIPYSHYLALSVNNLVTTLLIILCRNHYTIDVIIAFFMTHYIFNL